MKRSLKTGSTLRAHRNPCIASITGHLLPPAVLRWGNIFLPDPLSGLRSIGDMS
jgi:hypothetical protein